MQNKKLISMVLVTLFFLCSSLALAQLTVPETQTGGALLRQREMRELQREEEKRIKSDRPKEEDYMAPDVLLSEGGEKILITKIVVEGVTLLPEDVVSSITLPFEGQELSLRDIQKIVDLITDEYRVRGFVTSRAYLPPQSITDNVLMLRVVEGRTGELEVRGNRYFRTALFRDRMKYDRDGYFDFNALQQSLTYINEHPDRTSRVVLVPGQEPGTTDVILEVDDRLPVHVGFDYDNYLSEYSGERQWKARVEHNNIFGFDDKFRLEWASSRHSNLYYLLSARYSIPINQTLESGVYVMKGRSRLGRELAVLQPRGETLSWGVFLNKSLISNETIDLRLTSGFDYKDIKNYVFETVKTSEDRIRVFKAGFDLDVNDRWGRNIFTAEYNAGVPHLLDGMSSKDDFSSRAGAGSGAKFQKGLFNYFRLQPMPLDSQLLWKTNAQLSNHNLVAGEQFQLGGPNSVRGYGLGEKAGDSGIYTSFEWTFPCYVIPRGWSLPFAKDRSLYDSIRFLVFYDWGEVHTKTPSAGEKKHETLRAAGPGLRLNISENLFVRFELGYPLHSGNKKPNNNKNVQSWFEINAIF